MSLKEKSTDSIPQFRSLNTGTVFTRYQEYIMTDDYYTYRPDLQLSSAYCSARLNLATNSGHAAKWVNS